MKTNIKILIITAVAVLLSATVGLWLLRKDIVDLQSKVKNVRTYKPVEASHFHALKFNGAWKVIIRQGKDYKVDMAVQGVNSSQPSIQNINGQLNFQMDTAQQSSGPVYVKITMPDLNEIYSESGSEIRMENFDSDSLQVTMKGKGMFTGFSNTIKKATYDVSGETRLIFKDDGM